MRWDVVIVGGGPAGAAAAGMLATGGAAVALFDSAFRPGPRWGETGPPRLRDVLVRQGLWDSFVEQDYPKVSGVTSFWGGADAGETDFLFQPPGHGWHVARVVRRLVAPRSRGRRRDGLRRLSCSID